MRTKIIYLLLVIAGSISCSPKIAKENKVANVLNGKWELFEISDISAFDRLYPEKQPMIIFDFMEHRVSGNTSCNAFSGPLKVDGLAVNFQQPMVMTKMACGGNGETTFMAVLAKVDGYFVSADQKTLHLKAGESVVMKFNKIYDRVE